MEFTNKYAKLLATKIAGKDEKQITEPVGGKERIFAPNSMNIPTETQCETKAFTIPPTCDKLDSTPKNVHYITKAEPNTSFVVVIDAEPHIENPDCLRRQILNGLCVYTDEGNEEYSISKLRGNWPYNYKYNEDGAWDLEECESFTGESLADGFFNRLVPLKYMNGNLVYEHGGEQFRLQLTNKTHMHFSYYCYNYTTKVKTKIKRQRGKCTETVTGYKDCEISFWPRCSTSAGSETRNCNEAHITYKDLNDKLKEVIEDLIGRDAAEQSTDEIRFLQGEYRGTQKHDYKDHDGNPCGAMEYYCSKTWTNEHYTLMTQKGDRAWDVYRWIIGYITSMDFMSKSVEFRHFIWFACKLSSIGKTKMLNKCFPQLVCDPNPTNGEDTFSKRKTLECPLLIADDGDLIGLAKNKSYLTRLNKRVGNGCIPVRLMREEEVDIKRTVFNMSISNVEPPKELYSGDTTNLLTRKCRYVYINLSDTIYHDDTTSAVNINEVSDEISRAIPSEYIREDEYTVEVDLFKSDCLRFYKANPQFMDKYLGAMKQANTSSAKSCFEDYIDYAEANNAWSENAIEDSEKVPLGVLFRKQISCIDDYTVLKKYFDQWAKDHDLEYERTQKRIPGLKGNPIMQPLVSKETILKLYN